MWPSSATRRLALLLPMLVGCPDGAAPGTRLDVHAAPPDGASDAATPPDPGFGAVVLCDDGDPCTVGDRQVAQTCSGTPYDCAGECRSCDGLGGCLLSPSSCFIAGACVSAGAASGEAPCLVCAPQATQEGWSHAPTGTPCDDGDARTGGDRCAGGVCSGAALDPEACAEGKTPCTETAECDDSNPCTADACVAECGCVHVPVGLACDDGDACTTGDACAGGECAPGAPVSCEDGDPCTADVCSPDAGCLPAPGCDDGDPCTDDQCDAAGQCSHSPGSGPCDDGDPCTAEDTCAGGQCQPGGPADCDDGLECTDDWCDPATGCAHAGDCCGVIGAACPEGFECTEHGTCESDTEVFVPGGTFWMGGTWKPGPEASYIFNPQDWPPVEVVLSPFAIDRTEVTVAAYAECVEAGVCEVPALEPIAGYVSSWYEPGLDDHPITQVTWPSAKTYCEHAKKQLPTEAQWEMAARGGCQTVEGDCKQNMRRFPWGDAPATCELAVFLDGSGYSCGAGYATWPVGSRPAGRSPYGALDMAGNAIEWAADWWAADYYCHGPEATCLDVFCGKKPQCGLDEPPYQDAEDPMYAGPWVDPEASPIDGAAWQWGSLRGGQFADPSQLISSTWRRAGLPYGQTGIQQLIGVGFRCARPLAP